MAERSGAERPDSECGWGGACYLRDDDSPYLPDSRLLAHKLVFDRQFVLPVTNYELFTNQQPHQTHQTQHQHQHQPQPQSQPQSQPQHQHQQQQLLHQHHQQHQPLISQSHHHVPQHHQMHHQMRHQPPHILSYPPRHDPSYGFPSQHLPNYDDSNRNFMNSLEPVNLPQLRPFEHPSIPDNNSSESYLTNWPGDSSGVYTPFGHNFLSVQTNSSYSQTTESQHTEPVAKKEVEPLLADPTVKKRIVAEVKPMRPSYSAVLSKTPKNSPNPEPSGKKSNGKEFNKNQTRLGNVKLDKSRFNSGEKSMPTDEKFKKLDSKRKVIQSQPSSGSDSGENNAESKSSKSSRRNYSAGENINRKWVSLDDLSNDTNSLNSDLHQNSYTENYNSEFVFMSRDDDKFSKKKTKKPAPLKTSEKSDQKIDADEQEDSNGPDDFVYQEPPTEVDKSKRKNKDGRPNNNSRSTLKNNSDRNKRNNQAKPKKSKGSGYIALLQTYLDNWIAILLSLVFWFFNLVSDICQMSIHLSADLVSSMFTETFVWTQNAYGLFKEKAMNTQWICNFGNYVDSKLGHTYFGFWRKLKWFKSNVKSDSESDNSRKNYANIPLPSTGEDAMRRLLACKGKDPYSILGVGVQCTDDDIKRYYRRQAFLVHPDKNQQPGAEEAFKILQHAFDMIGEPERREAYEQRVLESRHAEVARSELADLVARLQEKVRRAASTIRCSGCSRRHARTPTNRPCYAARYCAQCKINHAAKEGDIWAESSFWGLVWMYYACMDGAVYQITQWASCQKKNLKHLKANTHHVQYRIVHGNKPQQGSGGKSANNNIHDADLEDFLNNLYTKSGVPPPGAGSSSKTMPNSNPTSDPMKTKRKNKKQNFK